MPAEPFLDSHAKLIDVLVHLLKQGRGLDDRLVLAVHVKFHVVARESVSETQFGLVDLESLLFDESGEVGTDAAEELEDHVVSGTLDGECISNQTG